MNVLLPTYRSLASSHSEYLKNLWWPYNQTGLDKQLEKLQMNLLSKIKGLKNLTYTEQLLKCKLLSMKRKQEFYNANMDIQTHHQWQIPNVHNPKKR